MSAHASASPFGATSSTLRPRAWLGGGLIALLAFAAWLGMGADRAAAAECPNEAIRIAQSATHLPSCRAYERVSPADSTGGVIGVDSQNRPLFAAVRADGNAMTFGSSSAVGDSERGALRTFSLAHRSSSGWSSFGVWNTTQQDVYADVSMAPSMPTPSSDMTRMMFGASRSLGPPNPLTVGRSIYLSSVKGQGAPTWLSRSTLEGAQPGGSGIPLGGAPDYGSGYFTYPSSLLPAHSGIYRFEGETLAAAGVLPSGEVSPGGAIPAGSVGNSSSTGVNDQGYLPQQERNQVSADGTKLFFVSPASGADPKQLYVQEGNAPGRLISHDEEGNPALAGISQLRGGAGELSTVEWAYPGFAYATSDGSRVLFRSTSTLTDDAPAEGLKTYRAQITPSSIELDYLPDANGHPLAIDEDASVILFGVPGSEASKRTVLLWDEDRAGEVPFAVVIDVPSNARSVFDPVLSADGNVVVFGSDQELEPGLAPRVESRYTQVFRWTQQREVPVCISCRRDGETPARFGAHLSNGPATTADNAAFPNGTFPDPSNQSTMVGNRKISSDGSRVFFDTSDPLDPTRDINGTRDVYMWEDGQLHLLTTGRSAIPSLIFDNSESGDDLLMLTADGLLASDTNGTYDVYDVRVNGGFDETVEVGCSGDACQLAGAAAPAAALPGTLGLRGPGNQGYARLGGMSVVQRGVSAPTAKLRIKVPASGRLKLAGNLIKNKSRPVRSKGGVTVTVALNKKGKRKLARNDQLRTKVRVTFRAGDGRAKQRGTTLRFKQGGTR